MQDHFHTEAGPGYGTSPGWSRPFLIFGYWPQGEGIDWSEMWAGDFTHFPSLCNDVGCWARLGTCVPHPLSCTGSKCVGYLSSFLPSCSCDSCWGVLLRACFFLERTWVHFWLVLKIIARQGFKRRGGRIRNNRN